LGIPLIAVAGNLGCLFFIERPWLRPSLSCVRLGDMRKLFDVGLLFLVLHLTYIVAFASDNLLAIWICGPEAAGLYAIAVRLFAPCRLVATTLMGPLWPAYGEAIARGDIVWARRAVVASIIAAEAVVVPLALVGLLFGPSLASLWFQRPISLGFGLLAGLALQVVLETMGSGLSMFLNGASVIRAQLPLCITFAATTITAKVSLASQFGVAGIIWGAVLPYVMTQVIPYVRLIQRTFRDLERRSAITER
jgi:O-antigen/teichoic acid export membrane protein